MALEFDVRGNLFPAEKIECTLEEFEEFFVKRFPESGNRGVLWETFLDCLNKIIRVTGRNIVIWANGSFVTHKPNPGDFDILFQIDVEVLEKNRQELILEIFENPAIRSSGLHLSYIAVFPKGHSKAFFTLSDRAYWYSWFNLVKLNRGKKQIHKGFVEFKGINSDYGKR